MVFGENRHKMFNLTLLSQAVYGIMLNARWDDFGQMGCNDFLNPA